jgi:hypothetical protein
MKIGENDINELLGLFYEGKTSIEQELELHRYFVTAKNIPEELQADREVVLKLSSLPEDDNSIDLPQGFDERLEKLFESFAEKKKKKLVPVFRFWKQAAGIAASIAILLSAGIFFQQNRHQPLTDTYDTPEEAYIETQRALLLVSEKMNKGFNSLDAADKNISKASEILNKRLN